MTRERQHLPHGATDFRTDAALAVYIHVPFCVRKCVYCDFYSEAIGSQPLPRHFLDALLKEISLRAEALRGRTITSVYFGGGTPSLLPSDWVVDVLETLTAHASFSPDVEITLECNPGTVALQGLRAYRGAGINRLSIGVQSFDDATLSLLGRIHTSEQAHGILAAARLAGFENISADLIFGVPGQKLEDVFRDLSRLLPFAPEHVSYYELTVEQGTPLAKWVQEGRVHLPGESIMAEMFLAIHEQLETAGYEHYEVSNYALPGRRCRHNLVYWHRQPYIGFGPAAHSFDGQQRLWNVRNWEKYISRVTVEELPLEDGEILSESEALEEEIALGLRLVEGLDLHRIAHLFGKHVTRRIRENRMRFYPFLELRGQHLRPSLEGFLRADQLAMEVLGLLAKSNSSNKGKQFLVRD